MISLRSLTLSAAVAALLAAPLSAQQIDTVSTNEGTTGTMFSIDGSGFGTAKPKVELWDMTTGKKAKGSLLKVTDFTDTSLDVEIKKAVEGDYDLVVKPKGKGVTRATAADPFTIRAISGATPAVPAGDPGEEITVFADFLGTKKAKVKVGGKKAPVRQWAPVEIAEGAEGSMGFFVFKMPKKLADGTYDIEIRTKTYTVTIADFIEVQNSNVGMPGGGGGGGGSGGLKFTAKVGGKSFKATGQTLVYETVEPVMGNFVTNFTPFQTNGSPIKGWSFSLDYNPADGPAVLSGADLLLVSYSEGIFPNVTSYLAGNDFQIDVKSVAANEDISGTFSGTLNELGGPGTKSVTGGTFKLQRVDEL